VEDRVADSVLLLLDLRRGLRAAVGLVAMQEEGVRVLVVTNRRPSLEPRSGKYARKSLLKP
jgi:hypothetical protein